MTARRSWSFQLGHSSSGQGVISALAAAGDTPQLVIAKGVAAVEVADALGAVVGRGSRMGLFCFAQDTPWQGRTDSGPNWSNAKHRSGKQVVTCSMPPTTSLPISGVLSMRPEEIRTSHD